MFTETRIFHAACCAKAASKEVEDGQKGEGREERRRGTARLQERLGDTTGQEDTADFNRSHTQTSTTTLRSRVLLIRRPPLSYADHYCHTQTTSTIRRPALLRFVHEYFSYADHYYHTQTTTTIRRPLLVGFFGIG